MKNKKTLLSLVATFIAVFTVIFIINKDNSDDPTPTPTSVVSLPINTIPVTERPFLTLTPNATGRSLELLLDNTEVSDLIEYELIYQAGTKQEGVFGRLNLASETLPITKDLLLGSRSAGGKTTYHEDITGGSLTLTYLPAQAGGETKLKESFNFLRFDSNDPVFSSPDARFSVELAPTSLADGKVIVVMKTFGLPAELPTGSKLVAGPYTYLPPSSPKGEVALSIRLPAGEHINPTIYEYNRVLGEFTPLSTILLDDTVTATATTGLPAQAGSTFIVTTD